MVLDAGGRPTGSAPLNPIKMGRIVHACDPNGNCAPMLIRSVFQDEVITGVAFAAQMMDISRVAHDIHPDVTARIKVPNRPPTATWHWPGECPWNR